MLVHHLPLSSRICPISPAALAASSSFGDSPFFPGDKYESTRRKPREKRRRGSAVWAPEMTKKKQFCPRGHDTFQAGRDASKRCIQCKAEDAAAKDALVEQGSMPTSTARRTRSSSQSISSSAKVRVLGFPSRTRSHRPGRTRGTSGRGAAWRGLPTSAATRMCTRCSGR